MRAWHEIRDLFGYVHQQLDFSPQRTENFRNKMGNKNIYHANE